VADLVVRHEIDLSATTQAFLLSLIRPVIVGLTQLETRMTEISDFLDAQSATLDQISTALADVTADVEALLAKASSSGVFSAEEQASADAVAAKLAAVSGALGNLDTEVGDQDGSDTPPTP